MRNFAVLIASLLLVNCASYRAPGAAVALGTLSEAGAAQQPAPRFPVKLAVVRVQAPDYRSASLAACSGGRFCVVPPELLSDEALAGISGWAEIAGAARLDATLLPAALDSIEDLRFAAAKMQADVLLAYTVDTRFELGGRAYKAADELPLGDTPDAGARITSTIAASFVDVRSGYVFGTTQAGADGDGLAAVWGSPQRIDTKRLETERAALAALLGKAQQAWAGIVGRYR